MAQVKKPRVREAILDAARTLFARQSYQATTLTQIARRARVSSANIYVYFDSKLDILYTVYEPWMRARLATLQRRLARVERPVDRLRLVLRTLWKEIPAEENGFVNNIIQALSTADAGEHYDPTLMQWMEQQISEMIRGALPPGRRRVVDSVRLAHLSVMALDGYSIHHHIRSRGVADDRTIDAVAALMLGRRPAKRGKTVR